MINIKELKKIMHNYEACMSNVNIKCRSQILSNEVFKNKQTNKKKNLKNQMGIHIHVTHTDKNNDNYNSRK